MLGASSEMVSTPEGRRLIFYSLFPEQVDKGRAAEGFKWVVDRITDGNGVATPRDLLAVFDQAKGAYDRVIILSDMQAWIGRHTPKSAFDAYVARSGKRPRIYSFDLAGHGTLQFPEREVYALAGWSDKVLDTLKFLEQDKHALVREIENIEL